MSSPPASPGCCRTSAIVWDEDQVDAAATIAMVLRQFGAEARLASREPLAMQQDDALRPARSCRSSTTSDARVLAEATMPLLGFDVVLAADGFEAVAGRGPSVPTSSSRTCACRGRTATPRWNC